MLDLNALVSVQPMKIRSDSIFYLDYTLSYAAYLEPKLACIVDDYISDKESQLIYLLQKMGY